MDDTCDRRCKSGFRPGGDADASNAAEFLCKDKEARGVLEATGSACVESKCDPKDIPDLEFDAVTCSEPGAICAATCKGGKDVAPAGTSHMKCSMGAFRACTDATCTAPASSAPVCVAKGGKSEERKGVAFALEFQVADVAAVSAALDSNPGKVADAFKDGACATFDCAANGLEVETKTIRVDGVQKFPTARRLAAGGIEVEFQVTSKDGSTAALEQVKQQIKSIEEDGDSSAAFSALKSGVTDALAAANVEVAITGVAVTQAAEDVTVLVVTPPKKKEEAGGSSVGVIVGVVVAVVVLGIAGVVWKKKKGASVSSA